MMPLTPARAPRLLAAAATLVLAAGLCADEPAAAAAAAKPYSLFMGTDIEVQVSGALRKVKNVAGDAFLVVVDQKPVEIPMNRGPVSMKVSPSLKISDRQATVRELKVERAYTPENDPVRRFTAAQSAGAAQAALGNSAGKMASALMGSQLASQRAGSLGGPGGVSLSTGNDAANAVAAYNTAQQQAGNDLNSVGYAAGQMQSELDKELFDAVEVTCEVSAPQSLRDPYIVVVTTYKDQAEPNATKSWILARALEHLDERPLKVRILQGGFPPGFELGKTQFHIYAAGGEIGSNVADKSVALTRDEAHEYVVLDHVASHKGATLPASLALAPRATDLRQKRSAEQLEQKVYVQVDQNGVPAGAFRNEACTEPLADDLVAAAVTQARFKPALAAGKAVPGVAAIRVAELAR